MNLNPAGVEAAARTLDPEMWELAAKHPADGSLQRFRKHMRVKARKVLNAYFTVDQTILNSVAELDALPVGAVVRDKQGSVWTKIQMPIGVLWYVGGIRHGYDPITIRTPARLLDLPEDNNA